MHRTIRFGRWTAELYQRAIYLTRGPDRSCPDCRGEGGIEVGHRITDGGDVDYDTDVCGCWDPAGIRIPLWRRRQVGVPF